MEKYLTNSELLKKHKALDSIVELYLICSSEYNYKDHNEKNDNFLHKKKKLLLLFNNLQNVEVVHSMCACSSRNAFRMSGFVFWKYKILQLSMTKKTSNAKKILCITRKNDNKFAVELKIDGVVSMSNLFNYFGLVKSFFIHNDFFQ